MTVKNPNFTTAEVNNKKTKNLFFCTKDDEDTKRKWEKMRTSEF